MEKTVTALALVLLMAFVYCAKEEPAEVVEGESAPYFVDLDEALTAASADQYIVVDFYTDW